MTQDHRRHSVIVSRGGVDGIFPCMESLPNYTRNLIRIAAGICLTARLRLTW